MWGLIFANLDNLLLNNYWRKYYTYIELGWDDVSIKDYLSQKKMIMQIASFNTPKVSFSASSRRNRFYEVYNRPNMLEQDVAFGNAIETLTKLSAKYKIFVISSRTSDLKDKTLEVMEKLNFPLDKMTIYFNEPSKSLHNYRQKCLSNITNELASGIGVCLQPGDGALFGRCNYTPIGFTSLKEIDEFGGSIQIVCQDWIQVLSSLNSA
jgi:hypothetical protein